MPDDRPPASRPGTRREVLKDSTDVTSWTNRELLIRAVDATLDLAQGHGSLMRAHADQQRRHNELRSDHNDLAGHVGEIDDRVSTIERALGTDPPPSARERETSYHDFDPALAAIRRDIADKVKDPHHPISEASALRLIQNEAAKLRDATELGRWRSIKTFFSTTGGKIFDRVTTVLIAAAVGWLIHYLTTKH